MLLLLSQISHLRKTFRLFTFPHVAGHKVTLCHTINHNALVHKDFCLKAISMAQNRSLL